jgi:hypothetical protein
VNGTISSLGIGRHVAASHLLRRHQLEAMLMVSEVDGGSTPSR